MAGKKPREERQWLGAPAAGSECPLTQAVRGRAHGAPVRLRPREKGGTAAAQGASGCEGHVS